MAWIIGVLRQSIDAKFTGYIQINFFQGAISNINKLESIKPPAKEIAAV